MSVTNMGLFNRESLSGTENRENPEAAAPAAAANTVGGKYVPPSRRGAEGSSAGARLGDTMPERRRDDTAAVRYSTPLLPSGIVLLYSYWPTVVLFCSQVQ